MVQHNKTILSNEWQNIITATYNYLFGENYMERNPLRQQRRQMVKTQNIVQSNNILTNNMVSNLQKVI